MGVFLNLSTSKTHKGFGQIFKHIKPLVVLFRHIKALIKCHVLIKMAFAYKKMACAYKKRVYLNFHTSARWSAYGCRSMYLCIVLPHTTRIPEGIMQGNKLGGFKIFIFRNISIIVALNIPRHHYFFKYVSF